MDTIGNDLSFLSHFNILFTSIFGETPLVGDEDLLTTRELVLGTTESFNNDSLVDVLGTDGQQNLTDINTGSDTFDNKYL